MRFRVYIDGASRGNPGPAAAAMVLQDESGRVLATKTRFLGVRTNNYAEWAALKGAARVLAYLARRFHSVEATIYTDSELMARQFNGEYRVRNDTLRRMAEGVRKILDSAPQLEVRLCHIPREQNVLADAAANRVLDALRRPETRDRTRQKSRTQKRDARGTAEE